ncbi:SpoIVB peptidase S55, partial [human gut metagenome]
VSPGDTIVVDVTLEPFRGEKVIKQIFFKVPEDQAIGKYTLEVRGGGEIPLPYVLEKQKYNLTDEILRRLKVH